MRIGAVGRAETSMEGMAETGAGGMAKIGTEGTVEMGAEGMVETGTMGVVGGVAVDIPTSTVTPGSSGVSATKENGHQNKGRPQQRDYTNRYIK